MLNANKVKATFHVVTKYLNNVSVLSNLQEAEKAGHVIGLRFPTEIDPTKASDETIRKVLRSESNNVYSAIKKYPKYLRLPSGKDDDRVVQIAQEEGFVVTRWNFDPEDYATGVTAGAISTKLQGEFSLVSAGRGRYIALVHDIYDVYKNTQFLGDILGTVKNSGYTAVTLQDCLSDASAYRDTNGGGTTTTQSTNDAASSSVPSFMVPFVASLAALAL